MRHILSSRCESMHRLRIPPAAYQFARFFGAGVIIATALILLLDPVYSEIDPEICIGMIGGWAEYSWPPTIVLTAVMCIFLIDLSAERYVEMKYGASDNPNMEDLIISRGTGHAAIGRTIFYPGHPRVDATNPKRPQSRDDVQNKEMLLETISFHQQLAAFLNLEFGIIFHSVIIGLNLGVVGSESNTLFPVLVFHHSFDDLGIGARLSAFSFPQQYRWMLYMLCLVYGLTTPVSIAIGIGLRTTYNPGSFTGWNSDLYCIGGLSGS
jgi:zinc transporter 1/2/3